MKNYLHRLRLASANTNNIFTPVALDDFKERVTYSVNGNTVIIHWGQVVQQKSPDGGLSKLWYDRLGRLVVSQNAKQATANKYSYTQYDILGRIEEVGQLTSSTAITQTTSQSEGLLGTWLSNANNNREQITVTKYDEAQTALCVPALSLLCQPFTGICNEGLQHCYTLLILFFFTSVTGFSVLSAHLFC